jgi:Domain of unknown function (DUF4350)
MPLGIARSDRNLLLVGGALLLAMLAGTVVLSPPEEQLVSPVPSTYSGQPGGAEAAYLLLSQLHYPVRRWEDAPADLPSGLDNLLLILAEPTQPPTRREQQAIVEFVNQGGHVLFTGENISTFFPDASLSWVSPNKEWKTFSPVIPTDLARRAQHITLQVKAYWDKLDSSQFALYGEAGLPVVVRWRLGEGEILWWAGSTPLTNAGITRDNNLAFFLNSVSNWSPDKPYQIYWDEYFHGQRSSLWSYMGKTSLRGGLLQLGLAGLAVIFTFSRRSGPVYAPPHLSRLSPLEFVDTLGGLYERAHAASSAVSVSRLRLRVLLTRQLGLPRDVPDAALAQAAEQRFGWKNSGLAELLERSGAASSDALLRPRDGLDLVQRLERQAAKLELRP